LVAVSEDGIARLWDLTGDRPVDTVLERHVGLRLDTYISAFSPDGRRLVTASTLADNPERPTVRLWDLTGERPVPALLEGHTGPVLHAAFSPDGRRLVTASGDSTTRLWDLHGERPAASVLEGHTGNVIYAAFSPDGRRLVTTSSNGLVLLFDVPTGQELLAFARSRLTRCLSDAQRDAFGLPPHPNPTADRNQIRPPTEC
jgi:WD40 repeat protein